MGLRLGAPASADVLAPQGATLRQLNDAERLFPEVPKSATPSMPSNNASRAGRAPGKSNSLRILLSATGCVQLLRRMIETVQARSSLGMRMAAAAAAIALVPVAAATNGSTPKTHRAGLNVIARLPAMSRVPSADRSPTASRFSERRPTRPVPSAMTTSSDSEPWKLEVLTGSKSQQIRSVTRASARRSDPLSNRQTARRGTTHNAQQGDLAAGVFACVLDTGAEDISMPGALRRLAGTDPRRLDLGSQTGSHRPTPSGTRRHDDTRNPGEIDMRWHQLGFLRFQAP